LLAGLTEHWQRPGDLAAWTIFVADEPHASRTGATPD